MSAITALSGNYLLQSITNSALQNVGVNTTKTSGAGSSAQQSDNSRLSPFAQVMSELQQVQQSDPSEYRQVTQQISTNLQGAAQTAQADGNSGLANQLNQLSTDFSSASKSGQLPNMQDLAQAVGGGHHHHHHAHAASSDSDSSSSSSSSSAGASQSLSQLLAAFQSNSLSGFQNSSDSLNPLNIISSTLSNAGITGAGLS